MNEIGQVLKWQWVDSTPGLLDRQSNVLSLSHPAPHNTFTIIITRAKNVQTMEELRDVYQHFLLYYGTDIPRMKAQQRQVRRKTRDEDGEGEEEDEVQEPEGLKQASRKTGYSICVQAGLGR